MSATKQDHWEHVFGSKGPTELSWFQPVPSRSMAMIRATGIPLEAPVIDIGAGVSSLVDLLLNSDYSNITVLDISAAALAESRARLRDAAARVKWIRADVLEWPPLARYYVWHDRAMFHFLRDPGSVDTYLNSMRTALVPGGHLILATFGPEGPDRCSGLDVQRYSIERLTALLGDDFELKSYELEDHKTPTGNLQQYLYSRWQMTA
jgi:SAM-dependent methyltransferase